MKGLHSKWAVLSFDFIVVVFMLSLIVVLILISILQIDQLDSSHWSEKVSFNCSVQHDHTPNIKKTLRI